MGGAEDHEPPAKRVRLSLDQPASIANGSSFAVPTSCSLGNPMTGPPHSQGDEEMVGSKGVIKKTEFIRIITKALYTLGYEKSGRILEEESGVTLHSPLVNLFQEQILDGQWDASVLTLQHMDLSDQQAKKSASFLIMEHKFFELIYNDKIMEALKTLRTEIVPLRMNTKRVHELSSCIISPSQNGLNCTNGPNSVNGNSRIALLEKLQNVLPPTFLIPERRLEHLVEQALGVQRKSCVFHNSLDNTLSLYSDHQCGREQIPSQTMQVLQAHHDEVWFLMFSNNGRYLASSSSDHSAILWEVNADSAVTQKHVLIGHQRPVSAVAWSPDDYQILTCGIEESVRRWDVESGTCLHIYEKPAVGLISCGWLPDGKRIFSGIADKSISMWDLDGKEVETWKGHQTLKISDMAVTSDGKTIITMCMENGVLLLEREAGIERLIEEEHMITSFCLSKDDKYLLVNLINQEIHLWSIVGDLKLVARYRGHKRTRFIIRSCFGGFQQAFIASGSEDSQVYIWHRATGEPLAILPGHSGAVNCVSWNPANPHMLASASDDRTIRIWGLSIQNFKVDACTNGAVHFSNGSF